AIQARHAGIGKPFLCGIDAGIAYFEWSLRKYGAAAHEAWNVAVDARSCPAEDAVRVASIDSDCLQGDASDLGLYAAADVHRTFRVVKSLLLVDRELRGNNVVGRVGIGENRRV